MPKSPPPASPEAYLAGLPDDRRALVQHLRDVVNANLPEGIEEGMQYGMIGWFVPHALYPEGYHCDPAQPVPYVSLANQKGAVSLYLFCMYTDSELSAEFARRYRDFLGKKPNMGKSCVRFKRLEDVPDDLLAETLQRMPLQHFLDTYTAQIPPSARKTRR